VRTEAEKIGHGLDGAKCVEQQQSFRRVVHALFDIAQRERDPFEAHQ